MLACALAKHQGAKRIVAIDINPARLDFAKRNGFADDVFCLPPPGGVVPAHQPDVCCSIPSKTPSSKLHSHPHPAQVADETLRRAREGALAALSAFGTPEGFDIVFECTGAESAIQMSIFVSPLHSFPLYLF